MTIGSIINVLETVAPPSLQEPYDNAGLLIGTAADSCTGVLVTLDVTEAVVDEAVAKGANLIVAHHPLIFNGLKRISPDNHVGATVIRAIRNGIAVYAIHTNLDNVLDGFPMRNLTRSGKPFLVQGADKLGIIRK
jgi:putative NIF3 family GTP cyclohydrolase 1 type 2